MEGSANYELTVPGPKIHFARPRAASRTTGGSSIAFKILVLFLLILYSNIAVIFPALDSFRPAMVLGIAALLMMIVEVARSGEGFKLSWPEGYMLVGLLGVAIVSSFSAIYVSHALQTTADFAKIVVIYLIIENTVTSEKRLRTIMMTMVIAGMMPMLGTINNFMHGVLVEGRRASWVGIFQNPNEDAYSLTVLVPIAIAIAASSGWFTRIALWGIVAGYVLAIFLTFSRGGLVSLFVVIAYLCWKQKSIVLRGLMVAGLVGGLLLVGVFWGRKGDFKNISSDTTFMQRIATFRAGALMFMDKPVLGVGPGDSVVAYPLYVPKEAHCGCQDQLIIHNAFLQILSEMGVMGFVPFMIFLGMAVIHSWKVQKVTKETGDSKLPIYATGLELALVGFLAAGLSGGFSYTWFPYIIVGLIVAAKRISETPREVTS